MPRARPVDGYAATCSVYSANVTIHGTSPWHSPTWKLFFNGSFASPPCRTARFKELLTFNQDNEIHRVPLPAALAGRTFRWLLREMNTHLACILIFVQRGNDLFTNPQGEFLLQEGDQLFVVAERPPKGIESLAR